MRVLQTEETCKKTQKKNSVWVRGIANKLLWQGNDIRMVILRDEYAKGPIHENMKSP